MIWVIAAPEPITNFLCEISFERLCLNYEFSGLSLNLEFRFDTSFSLVKEDYA